MPMDFEEQHAAWMRSRLCRLCALNINPHTVWKMEANTLHEDHPLDVVWNCQFNCVFILHAEVDSSVELDIYVHHNVTNLNQFCVCYSWLQPFLYEIKLHSAWNEITQCCEFLYSCTVFRCAYIVIVLVKLMDLKLIMCDRSLYS